MISAQKEYLLRIRDLMKNRRVAVALKQSEAAARAGIKLRTVQHFEQTGEISLEKLIKLLIAYRMDPKFIASLEDRSWWTLEEIERAETKRTVR